MTPPAPARTLAASRRDRPSPPPASFQLDETKLHPPRSRPGIVDRSAIVERLLAAPAPSVSAVVAPAGFGKTTVLAQWARRTPRRVAWVAVDERDNDPAVLMTYLAVALDRVERIEAKVFGTMTSRSSGLADVAHLAASMAAMSVPVALVLDNAEALTNRACRDILAELAPRLPTGAQLVIGSREELPLPVSRLRAQGAVVEIGAGDLTMSSPEAHLLLARAGVDLSEAQLEQLVERTEGWPAGLYLAALAIKAGSPRVDVGFTGDERFMADYLRSEFLARVSRAEVSFLTRSSILPRLTGPLCDVIVGKKGSGRILDRLERRNLLIIPLDRRGEWYRYHHLFRDLLHAELMRREPEMVAELHARAAAWYEANEMLEAAIEHAQRAGDADRVARLVLKVANPVWSSGRIDTVLGWMDWFAAHGLVEQYQAIAVHGALIHALLGQASDADRWAAAAERNPPTGTLPDGNTMEASLAYLRTLLCRDGLDEMRHDAELALQGLNPTSAYRPAMLHAAGVAHLLQGERAQADLFFARAGDEAAATGTIPFMAVVLAQRGMGAVEQDDWSEAEALAHQALAIVQDGQFDEYWTSALVYAWAARIECHRGDIARARHLVRSAARLRPLLTYALPIVSVQALLELAHAYIALAEPEGARAALRQIQDILQHRPALYAYADEANELRSKLEMLKGGLPGVSSLTTAELRLVPLLPTHLSYVQMSERLYVSRHTVKTQAMSIFRKLGVSSRDEAITRMVQLGLVAHA